MKENLTELVFILDRSGSMRGLEADTIGGFNSLIEKQKQEAGEAYVSCVLFDSEAQVIYDRVPLQNIEPMTDKQYYVRGSTALLDALGGAVHHIATVHRYAREEDRPAKTMFVVITDGMENASRHYSGEQVREMVKLEQEKYHWEFLFLGANIDAIAAAGRFGIRADRAVNYEHDGEGTRLNFESLHRAVSSYRASRNGQPAMDEHWADGIREDYARRHRR